MASPFNYKNTDKDPGIKTERLPEVVVTAKKKQKPSENVYRSGPYPKFKEKMLMPHIPGVTVPKYNKSLEPKWNQEKQIKQLLPKTRTFQESGYKQIMLPASKTKALRERPMTLNKFIGAQPLSTTSSNIYSSYKEQIKNLKNQ